MREDAASCYTADRAIAVEWNHGMGWHADAAQRRFVGAALPARIENLYITSHHPTIAIHVPILILIRFCVDITSSCACLSSRADGPVDRKPRASSSRFGAQRPRAHEQTIFFRVD